MSHMNWVPSRSCAKPLLVAAGLAVLSAALLAGDGDKALLGANRQPIATAESACTIDALQRLAPAGTTITAAKVVEAAATMPRYCQVDGFVATPGNAPSPCDDLKSTRSPSRDQPTTSSAPE